MFAMHIDAMNKSCVQFEAGEFLQNMTHLAPVIIWYLECTGCKRCGVVEWLDRPHRGDPAWEWGGQGPDSCGGRNFVKSGVGKQACWKKQPSIDHKSFGCMWWFYIWNIYTPMYVCVCLKGVYVHSCMYIYAYMFLYIYACICIYTLICMSCNVHTCMYIYIIYMQQWCIYVITCVYAPFTFITTVFPSWDKPACIVLYAIGVVFVPVFLKAIAWKELQS